MKKPTPLSQPEQVAGRRFRDDAQATLTAAVDLLKPDYTPPGHLKIYRHPCPKQGGVSTGLNLNEVYETSPWYAVQGDKAYTQDESLPGGTVAIPEGRFAFVYKRGKCHSCGQTALSPTGKFVVADRRPPLEGRVGR